MELNTGSLAIILIFGLPVIAILSGTLLKALSILKGHSGGSGKGMDAEEAQTMQEIHKGLGNLERRVESLETLLLERAREEKWEQLERDK